MKILKSAIVFASLLGSTAFADYHKLAECTGRTDKNMAAGAMLFVNRANDSVGVIVVSIDRIGVMISDKAASADEILIGDQYVSRLTCQYTP